MIKVVANLTRRVRQPSDPDERPMAEYLAEGLPARLVDRVNLVVVDGTEEARREIVDAEVYFGHLTPDLLGLAHKLRWVQSTGASQENHLFPEFIASDIVLTNVAGIYSEEIADHVYALILGLTRQIPRFTRNQDRHYWEPRVGALVGTLAGRTLGVIGLGGIGGEIARRAPAFRMRVVATRAHPDLPKPEYVDTVWGPDGLDRLLAESDVVVICTPETPRTRQMIGGRELGLMKSNALFVNIGRGTIVGLNALADALNTGAIAGAALDVFEVEPLPADHPLWEARNLIITPHMASVGEKYKAQRVVVFAENLARYLDGRPLVNVVDKAEWH
jgi:phosphoglycerate dehydrogenase-like enzyme